MRALIDTMIKIRLLDPAKDASCFSWLLPV